MVESENLHGDEGKNHLSIIVVVVVLMSPPNIHILLGVICLPGECKE